MEGNFTVITVSQQTENDMATWNTNVYNERKQLLASVSFFPIFSLILNYIYFFYFFLHREACHILPKGERLEGGE